MLEKIVGINNKLGLNARAAARFVKASTQFKCDILLSWRDIEVDAKSIMGVMMLAAPVGAKIKIRADGEDAHHAVEQLTALLLNDLSDKN